MGTEMISIVCMCPLLAKNEQMEIPANLSWHMMAKDLQNVKSKDAGVKEMMGDFSIMIQLVDSHTTSINQIEQLLWELLAFLNKRKNCSLPSDTIKNPK